MRSTVTVLLSIAKRSDLFLRRRGRLHCERIYDFIFFAVILVDGVLIDDVERGFIAMVIRVVEHEMDCPLFFVVRALDFGCCIRTDCLCAIEIVDANQQRVISDTAFMR